jgi:biopolymer transport protein ExbD/biopolymer transport protein TolR
MKLMKAPPVVSEINVTPMVDVMLVMLIIFMVIIPMLTKGAQVILVRAKNSIAMKDADKEDAVLIAITRDGQVFLSPGNIPVTSDSLAGKVKDLESNRSGTDKTVFIKSDYRARFETVTDVIDNLRTAGVDTLGLLTEPVQDQSKKPNL